MEKPPCRGCDNEKLPKSIPPCDTCKLPELYDEYIMSQNTHYPMINASFTGTGTYHIRVE